MKLGAYEVVKALGSGMTSSVFLGRHAISGREAALKVITFAGEAQKERFLREARAAASLAHPNVVTVYEVFVVEASPPRAVIAMELVRGGTFEERLARGHLEEREALRLVAAIARGVGHAHERGIVHRDLKPANVILDERGEPKVADFGLARQEGDQSVTATGAIVGTPVYASPEQARSERALPESDVWALGVILHECLTGEVPFLDATTLGVLARILHGEVRLRGSTPAWKVVGRALAKNPRDRFHSGTELAAACEAALAARPRAFPVKLLILPLGVLAVFGARELVRRHRSSTAERLLAEAAAEPKADPLLRKLEAARRIDESEAVLVRGGTLLLRVGADRLAREWFELAAIRSPRSFAPLVGLHSVAHAQYSGCESVRERIAALARSEGGENEHSLAVAAEAALRAGDPRRALELAQRSESALAWQIRGDARRERGDPREALKCYDRAIALAPEDPRAAASRAAVLEELGDDRAGREASAVLDRFPSFPDALLVRAHVAFDEGSNEKARQDVDAALAVIPNEPGAWALRADIYGALGRREDALASANRSLALRKNKFGLVARGRLLLESGRVAEGRADFEAAVALDENHAEAHLGLGFACYQLGLADLAVASFDRAVAIEPENPNALFMRAQIRLARGERDAAREDVATIRARCERLRKPPPPGFEELERATSR